MLTKSTVPYAFHDIELCCDIYEDEDVSRTAPVVLYFHPGSLTGGTRELLPPWLVQACLQRHWTLISASYRFLPQVAPQGLVDDAVAAYRFAQAWGGRQRRVIVVGASAGFFMANMICRHGKGLAQPLAMLCVTGTPTFQHEFYRSSMLLSPSPFSHEQVKHWLEGPLVAGDLPEGEPAFSLDMLKDGARNPSYQSGEHKDISQIGVQRWDLYDYYVYNNSYPAMLADIDPGFGPDASVDWPPTIFLHGEADPYLPLSLAEQAHHALGTQNSWLLIARDQPHLFECGTFLEDEGIAADTVRNALRLLDGIIHKT